MNTTERRETLKLIEEVTNRGLGMAVVCIKCGIYWAHSRDPVCDKCKDTEIVRKLK